MNINIGPKVDLSREQGRYRFLRYYELFCRDYKRQPRVIEFHLLDKDTANPEKLERDLESVATFLDEKNMESVSFHYPDEGFPSEVAWQRRTLGRIGKKMIREGDDVLDVCEAEDRLYKTIDLMGKIISYPKPILVTHKQGIQLQTEFFRRYFYELPKLRTEYLAGLLKEHKELLQACNGKIILGLENTAPIVWGDNEGGVCEQAFEHFKERLNVGGVFVLDVCHAAMATNYFKQDSISLPSMDSVGDEKNLSLASLEDYITQASPYTSLIHLADATGIRFGDEGLSIGTEGSIINWRKVLETIEKHVRKPQAVLEIKGSHKDYDATIGASLRYYEELI